MIDLRLKKIDKYIMKKFILTFFMALLLVIVIVVIFDISEKIDKFVANQAPLKAIIFNYYLNFIPYFMNMFSPLFVFITVIFFTSRMAANSEIIAILSGGISYRRMMLPYMLSAALIASVSLGLNFWVIPHSNRTKVEFQNKYIPSTHGSAAASAFNRSNVHYQINPGQFAYYESFSKWNNTAYKFTLETIEDNRLVSKMFCESAQWDSTKGAWKLRNYVIREYTNGLEDHIKTGAYKDTVVTLTIDDFYRNDKTVETLNRKELKQLIDTQKMRGDTTVMYSQMERNRRTAMPFSAFILTIMGVALTSQKKRGGTGWNIAIGIALAFLYILFQRFSEMFVYTGVLPPFVAQWIPNVIYTFIAIFLYMRAPK